MSCASDIIYQKMCKASIQGACNVAIIGPQGPTGAQGSNGAQGSQGSNGAQGSQGSNGAQGAQGAQGTNGSNGAQGANGTNGAQGAQGANGTNGAQGAQGAQGSAVTGYVASNYICQGILSTNQSLSVGVDTTIQFVDQYDPQNWYNPANYRFTPTIAGYYLIAMGGNLPPLAGSGQVNMQGLLNNNTFMFAINNIPFSSGITLNDTKLVYMNGTTDFCTFSMYSSVATNIEGNAQGQATWFSATLQMAGSFTGATGIAGPQGTAGVSGSTGVTGAPGTSLPYTTVINSSGAVTALPQTAYFLTSASGALTVTLPVSSPGIWVIVVNSSAANYTISPTSGTINGQPTLTFTTNQYKNFISDGTNWWYNN
jgi:hypothetical protein